VRYGLEGKLLDLGKQKEVPVKDLIYELLDFIDDVVDELDSRKEIEHIHTILERGTSADEQLKVYAESGDDFLPVVDMLIKNTLENVPENCFD
jgi:carboxylate-amine ligase